MNDILRQRLASQQIAGLGNPVVASPLPETIQSPYSSKNLLSYASVIKDREKFIKSGTKSGSDFNFYDSPNNKYFKIFFYFENGDVDGNASNYTSGGLLAPTWLANSPINELYNYNSAYSYLILNNEEERADLLKDFINLLSNINCESPWYFKEISGLDTALERKIQEIKMEDERKKISIKCMPDAFDDRIATLMDLYRAIVWSWQMKREIVPANLRKFDMGIYIFNDVHIPFHRLDYDYANFSGNNNSYQTSYKYIEFHNCEFDYDSAKTPLSSLDNSTGLSPEYTIDIYFDDCYETRYNEFLMKEIGDMIKWDTTTNIDMQRNSHDKSHINKNALEERLSHKLKFDLSELDYLKRIESEDDYNSLKNKKLPNYPERIESNGFLANATDQLLTTGVNILGSYAKRAVLGNLYTYSLTRIGDQISTLMNGGVMETANAVAEYITDSQQRNNKGRYSNDELLNKTNIFEGTKKPYINNTMGNIFKANTIANNI